MAAASNVVTLRPAASKVTACWEWIGPKEAEAILNGNNLNRALSTELVRRYATEMSSGEWDQNNAETIKLSADDELLDGQHRLWAVVESGAKLKFLVARGLSRESFKTIGIGKTRTTGDIVSIDGIPNANNAAAAAALILVIERGVYTLTMNQPSKFLKRSEIVQFCRLNGLWCGG